MWELAEFDAALILDGFQSAGNRRLGLIYPDMMDIALAEYLQAYVGDYEAVELTAALTMRISMAAEPAKGSFPP